MRRTLVLMAAAVLAGVAMHPAEATTATGALAAKSPCGLFDVTTRTDPALGAGLSLSLPYPANLIPAGVTPVVTIDGTPTAGTISYTVKRRSRTLLTSTAPATAGTLAVPNAGPGAYQLEARLTVNGVQVGGTCLRYGIAMRGAALDMKTLPAGRDWGGPAPAREVTLQKDLGGKIIRRGVSFAQAQTNPSSYDDTFVDAAQRAKASGMLLDVQVGQGGTAERAAINSSAWEDTVRALVTRQKGIVPYWEAWNEPNFDYFFTGSAADYVNKVLKPFYRAVHSADPAAKVVGGSTYGMDLDWWNAFAKAGGFSYLDVVAFHGYQWASGWEGTGMVSEILKLKQLKARYGATAKPLWDTESGYQSINDGGGPWLQADWSVRKLLWETSVGVPSQSFLIEGGWEDWSVIDQYRGVKPAAMALSTYTTVLQGRTFVGMVKVGKSWVYAARFGAQRSGGKGVLAIWTDGRSVSVPLKAKHTGWDETGGSLSVSKRIIVGGGVQYLTFSPGGPVL